MIPVTGVGMATCNGTIGMRKRIGIVGQYGVGNLGDDTVVAILIGKIREYYPDAELVGFSLNPADTQWRHGIKAFHISGRIKARHGRRPARLAQDGPTSRRLPKAKQWLKQRPLLFRPLKVVGNDKPFKVGSSFRDCISPEGNG